MDKTKKEEQHLKPLIDFLGKIPAIKPGIGSGFFEDGTWWVKFRIEIDHPLAWQTVQEIAFVANLISVSERLPTTFFPVSPPPYMNGGPKHFLSWVIESTDPEFAPKLMRDFLEGRMPRPVDDLSKWGFGSERAASRGD